MTRIDLANWIAENILKWKIGTTESYRRTVESYMYSAKGFFDVWDILCKNNQEEINVSFKQSHTKEFNVFCGLHFNKTYSGHGKDRYEAFYNTIYEALK